MRKINLIVIHCSDTYARMDIGVNEIRQWHLQRGFNDIGYHYVIRRDGAIEQGRRIQHKQYRYLLCRRKRRQ
jgi:N-acetylmuramoyl-L-alanine amidase